MRRVRSLPTTPTRQPEVSLRTSRTCQYTIEREVRAPATTISNAVRRPRPGRSVNLGSKPLSTSGLLDSDAIREILTRLSNLSRAKPRTTPAIRTKKQINTSFLNTQPTVTTCEEFGIERRRHTNGTCLTTGVTVEELQLPSLHSSWFQSSITTWYRGTDGFRCRWTMERIGVATVMADALLLLQESFRPGPSAWQIMPSTAIASMMSVLIIATWLRCAPVSISRNRG